MAQRTTHTWAAVVLTLLVGGLAVPGVLQSGAIQGPAWAWWTVFGLQLVGLVGALWLAELLPRRWALAATALTVVTALGLVALGPTLGWAPFVLILAASLSVRHVPAVVVTGIIATSSVVLVVALRAADVPWGQCVMLGALYTLIMIVSSLSDHAQLTIERNRTELAVLNTELRSTQALLAESSRTGERLRISRDLHDVIGHQLTGLILELEVASHQAEGDAHEHVVKARRIARELMDDVRATLADQRATAPDLETALGSIVDGVSGLEIDLVVDVDVPTDGPSFTALVRCTQEVVTNALRHAQATRLWIEITASDGIVVLTAHDDGVGARSFQPGNGLTGIVERTEELGGSAEFASRDGFRVTARVPAA